MFRAPNASDRTAKGLGLALLIVFLVAFPSLASADDKQVCLSSYVSAQTLRKTGKLGEAGAALVQCGRAVCPALIRDDCVRWFAEVERELPSVVLSVNGPDGEDPTDVAVQLDGAPFASTLDGRPIPVDPGPHELRFQLRDLPPVVMNVVIREGERGRILQASFSHRPSGAPLTTRSRFTPAVYGVGGATLLSLAVWAGVGLSALYGSPGLESTLATCRPNCPAGDVSDVRAKLIVADISGGVGLVGLATVTYLLVRAPKASAGRGGSMSLALAPVSGGLVSRWSISF